MEEAPKVISGLREDLASDDENHLSEESPSGVAVTCVRARA